MELVDDDSPKLDFVIIGAQKSGTSSLYNYLKLHPDIAMSSPMKEPGYFLDEQAMIRYWRGRGYQIASRDDLFLRHMLEDYRGQPCFGEASTYYTIGRQSREQAIPRRMADHNPEMKLVYILRNPLDRCVSNFLHVARKRRGAKSLQEFFATPTQAPVLTSCYFWQLSPFMEQFGESRVHVIVFEEMLKEPGATLTRLHEFLEVRPLDMEGDPRVYHRSSNRKDFAPQDLLFSKREYETVMEQIAPDVEALQRWLGRSIPDWDLSSSTWCGSQE